MKRDLGELSRLTFDLLVVGGGISGAATAWDAALRGLSVALVEKDDFGHATSSASSKVIHGGIRYLQQGLVGKVRKSSRERTRFLRIAPHLVHPIPFLVPTYGHGLKGKEILSAGMAVYDLLTLERNRVDDPAKRIPAHRSLSAAEVLDLAPAVPAEGLTGGVVYHDAQMHSAERTTLAFVLAAAAKGAVVANHVEAVELLRDADRVTGVTARDRLSGDSFDVRARLVVSLAGPWLFRLSPRTDHLREMRFTKGIHVVTRQLVARTALAIATRLPNEAIINRGGRHIFLIPWRGLTLIGTTNVPFAGEPDSVAPNERDVRDFLDEVNGALPAARLGRDDVHHAFGGLYALYGEEIREGIFKSASDYRIFDHATLDRVEGLVTALGARFTTARALAEECVDLAFRKLGKAPPACSTATTPVAGGDIGRYEEFLAAGTKRLAPTVGEDAARDLLRSYGSRTDEVLAEAEGDGWWLDRLGETRPVVRAVVRHAVRREMALTLGDVVFRRTGIGTIGDPGMPTLRAAAEIMAKELGWTVARTDREVNETAVRFHFADDAAPAVKTGTSPHR